MDISPISEYQCQLGEGPLWDVEEGALYWVDSLAPALFRYDGVGGGTRRWDLPGKSVGSLAVRKSGSLVLAMEQGFYDFDPKSGSLQLIAEPFAGRGDIRFNDGKVDPAGRFLAGGMNRDYLNATEPLGAMWRLERTMQVDRVLDGFVCFNGPCFSPDGETLYVTGRDMSAIEAFDYDVMTGKTSAGRVLTDDINPDGATVDAEGYIWSAQWDDACVLRISPAGDIADQIDVPGQIVTSVMFGGADLDIMYVTTALPKGEGATPPHAGCTLAIQGTGFKGLPEPRFAG